MSLTSVIIRGGSGVEGIAQGHLNSNARLTPKPIHTQHPIPAALYKFVPALGLIFLTLSNEGSGLTVVIQSTSTQPFCCDHFQVDNPEACHSVESVAGSHIRSIFLFGMESKPAGRLAGV